MKKICTLTEDERTTITNGLRVAAERFDEHVKAIKNGDCGVGLVAVLRLSEQFDRQARDSRELADLIDGVVEIQITPYVEAIHG